MDEFEISEVSAKVVELVTALGITEISKLPGAWQHRVDDTWRIAINGQDIPVTVEPENSMPAEIPPFEIAIWYNGWLAGLLPPMGGGGIIAAGEGANEDTLIAALDQAIARANNAPAS